ncbi:MAG: glycosyltransferase family 4 protein [Rhodobacter sp.]|nr:glycosyltransferase family 4 protein [Rhodobacter sp.]
MRRIAFFSLTPSPPAPPANKMVLQELQAAFPDHVIDVIYVLEQLKRAPAALAVAAIAAGTSYAPDLLRRRKAFKYAVFRTPWLFRWIKRRAADLIDVSAYDFSFQMQSLFDASVPGLPHFVYTDHTHLENLNYEGFDPADLYSADWIDCERAVYRNATMVFTRSSNVMASLVSQYECDPDRLACVYAGSNAAVPDKVPHDPERYARKNILFAGIDWQRKGGPTLLAAFSRVLQTHPDASLTIVGCTPDIGDTLRCRLVGRVPLDEMPKHFAAASVFCMPTQVEPFGIVFVEAMWHRLPIVATRVGAVPDMVEDGENGFLVPQGDVGRLAARLTALLDDPELCARFGSASLHLARDRYDWPAVVRRMKERIAEKARL